ncbi:Beta-TrCP [Dactylella cylindrospora]|nr:Beta-TrCP [Dactylella cylindrospora]
MNPVTAALTLGRPQSGYFSPMDECNDETFGSPVALSRVDDDMEEVDAGLLDENVSLSQSSKVLDQPPSLMQLPQMVDTFDLMPQAIKSYLMYQFLRRCDKNILQFVAEVVNPALKCDFLARLPTELSLNIIKFLDYRSLTNAAQVSKKWRILIDSDEWTWKRLFEADGYVLAEGELERAVREGWGYQDPEGFLDFTRLSLKKSQKQRQTVESLGKDEFNELISDLSSNEGFAAAVHAASANPPPGVGLPSLTNLHLGSMDSCVKVWSLDSGALLYTLEGHTSLVGLLDLSHDYLVSAAADASLRIWDPETGRFIRDLLTNLSGVWQVKFNERRCVAAVQRDNLTFIEVLDFGAARDGIPEDQRGRRIVVNSKGVEVDAAEIMNDDG